MNKFLIARLEEEGCEISKRRKIILRVNPLDRLFEKGFLSKAQFNAGKNYQFHHEIANISHHARPRYDGSAINSSKNPKEGGMNQSQLDSSRFIFNVHRKIEIASYTTTEIRGSYKVIDMKLMDILRMIFEKQISIRQAEKNLGMNHAIIEERVKLICEILVLDKKVAY